MGARTRHTGPFLWADTARVSVSEHCRHTHTDIDRQTDFLHVKWCFLWADTAWVSVSEHCRHTHTHTQSEHWGVGWGWGSVYSYHTHTQTFWFFLWFSGGRSVYSRHIHRHKQRLTLFMVCGAFWGEIGVLQHSLHSIHAHLHFCGNPHDPVQLT